MKLAIADIIVDPAIQIREGNDEDTVQRYMESFDSLPPVDVFDTEDGWLLADGFHRTAAGERLGRTEIEVATHEGTRAEAAVFAALANTRHGKPLSRAERNIAIDRLHSTYPEWSAQEIAKRMGVDPMAVWRHMAAEEVKKKTSYQLIYDPSDLGESHLAVIHRADEHVWKPLVEAAIEGDWSVTDTTRAVNLIHSEKLAIEDRQALLGGIAAPREFTPEGRRIERSERAEPTFADVKQEAVREAESNAGGRMLKRLMYEIETASRWPMGDLLLGLSALERRQMRERLPGVIAWLEALNAAVERDRSRLEAMR
jgi:ParB-like chromosome segregation protein Spo0J